MNTDNKYIFKALEILDSLQLELNIPYKTDDRYSSILKYLRDIQSFDEYKCHENEKLISNDLRLLIIEFIYSIEIKKLDSLLTKFISKIGKNNNSSEVSIEVLSDLYLIIFTTRILNGVNYRQHEDKVMLKYNKTFWKTGWNRFFRVCRGKIVDIKNKKIIVYPFDKFFNINECDETNINYIQKLLELSNEVMLMKKEDGSSISVTKLEDESVLINTNGEFFNEHTEWAKEIINDRYSKFPNRMLLNYTYVFELIHPLDEKVVDYKGEKKLILTAIRDLSTQKLLNRKDFITEATRLNLEHVEFFDFLGIDELLEITKTLNPKEIEGWVLRIICEDIDLLVKIKLADYCSLHNSYFQSITIKGVFKALRDDTLDDILSKVTPQKRELVLEYAEIIQDVLMDIEQSLNEKISEVYSLFDINSLNIKSSIKKPSSTQYKECLSVMKLINSYTDFYDRAGCVKYFLEGKSVELILKELTMLEFLKIYKKLYEID